MNGSGLNTANIDSAIRVLKAYYKMGDLDALRSFSKELGLESAPRPPSHEADIGAILQALTEMETFESCGGAGSCLQLAHPTVSSLIADKFYPDHVVANAHGSSWRPTAFPSWEYPRVRLRNVTTSVKSSQTTSRTSR